MRFNDLKTDREREIAHAVATDVLTEMRDWMDEQVRSGRFTSADRQSWGDLANMLQGRYGRLEQADPDYEQP